MNAIATFLATLALIACYAAMIRCGRRFWIQKLTIGGFSGVGVTAYSNVAGYRIYRRIRLRFKDSP